jgi:hypothetical protein
MADNCEPRKVDSNTTGLAFAETICGRLPTFETDGYLPIWYELEPNSYSDFGGAISTTSRSPINRSRQRKKGVTTDLNATAGFNQDYTQTNFNRLLQGFFFADTHEKPTTHPMNAIPGDEVVITGADTTSDTFTAAGGLSRFQSGQLVLVSGFVANANNGLHLVTGATDTALAVAENLVTETAPSGVTIQVVGWQLATAGANITMSGNIPSLALAATPVAATGDIDIGAVTANDTVTIGGIEYTFVSAITGEYQVLIGVDADASAANLATAINGGVIGTPAHPLVVAQAIADSVELTAIIAGTVGNTIDLVSGSAEITVSGANLSGGTGFSFYSLGLIPGEWVYLGADTANNRFANNAGYARVASISDQHLTFDKTTWEPEAETGTGKNINIFVGNTLRNEPNPDDIVTRYYEFQRTLGKDADGTQAEYLTRSVANELTLNIPLPEGEDAKLNADVGFISATVETRTGAEGLKAGENVRAPGEAAINTASNILRLRMTLLDPSTTRPTPLFAYITEGTLTINNNVTPTKAVSVLGALDVNVGNFDAGGEVTAIFTSVMATRAVMNNADVTVDFIAAANNAGFVYDIPLLGLGGGMTDIEAGREIRIPLEILGAENDKGYTMLYTNWPYLPTQAMPVAGGTY